ncbi:MAG: cysteine desulfurase family protein [Pseudomonadota bacterium]
MIYFDHNATTPVDPRVLEAMSPYLSTFFGNPSSLYRAGRVARSALETAREQVAALVGAHSSEIVFTSGGTEANNLALKGLAAAFPPGELAVDSSAHPSLLEPVDSLKAGGWAVHLLPLDGNGLIDARSIPPLLGKNLRFAAVMLANNETGVIQDMSAIVSAFRAGNVIVLCDAVQAAGKIPVDFHSSGVHSMSLSSHKIYGPKGVGALVISKELELTPILYGGGQEKGLRGGTENVPAIVGFGKAAEIALDELQQRRKHLSELRERLEKAMRKMPNVTIFGAGAKRLPNTVQFGVEGMDGEMMLMEFDRKGIAVSSGSACASGAGEPSHVLTAMGVPETLARSAVRVSFGVSNTLADVDKFVEILRNMLPRIH